MQKKKNILVCPLNWGLGHASRCIPIIKILNENGHNVFLAASGDTLCLLKKTFPENNCIEFDDYKISYSKSRHLVRKIFFQSPQIFFRIISEHYRLKKLIKKYQIDTVISDNRFGLWNKNVRTVYITHQINIKSPRGNAFFENILRKIHRYFILKYDVCWVPDVISDELKLSGELSGKYTLPDNAKYIGLLSDFQKTETPALFEYDICAVISGPEPQRTIFQEMLLAQFKNSDKKVVMILGLPSKIFCTSSEKNVTIFSCLPPSEIQKHFQCSEYIIARSGYSTIMDIASTGKKAILIPTPGQTEQEYLAAYLSEKKIFYSTEQQNFCLNEALAHVADYSGIYIKKNQEELKKEILNSI